MSALISHSVSNLSARLESPVHMIETEHATSFRIHPLGGAECAGVLENRRGGLSLRGTLSYITEVEPDFPVLQNFSTLQW